jgi:hypothetical protein
VPPTIHLALSVRAAEALRRRLNEEFPHYDDTPLIEAIDAELASQLSAATAVTKKSTAQVVAEQMAAAGAAAVHP